MNRSHLDGPTYPHGLVERIRLMLRTPPLPALSDGEASDRLRPYGQGVKGTPASPPGSSDPEQKTPAALDMPGRVTRGVDSDGYE